MHVTVTAVDTQQMRLLNMCCRLACNGYCTQTIGNLCFVLEDTTHVTVEKHICQLSTDSMCRLDLLLCYTAMIVTAIELLGPSPPIPHTPSSVSPLFPLSPVEPEA